MQEFEITLETAPEKTELVLIPEQTKLEQIAKQYQKNYSDMGLVPVIWFALLIAPAISGGLSEIVNALPAAMNNPFKIVWCEDSVKTVLIFIAAYGLGIGIYLSSRRNYRRGEEHGSAKWGDPRAVNKKYRDKDPFKNRIFTQHVRMGLDGRKHRRNLNTLVVGGSGAGMQPQNSVSGKKVRASSCLRLWRIKWENFWIFAEDLGFLTDSVRKLLADSGFPGMKVLQFAFDSREDSDYLPYHYDRNSVVYTGTHDNATTYSFFDTLKKLYDCRALSCVPINDQISVVMIRQK